MLLESGVQPDILVCRTEHPLSKEIRAKIALFCNLKVSEVIESIDADTIYDVPLLMRKEKLDKVVLSHFKLASKQEPELTEWVEFLSRLKNPLDEVHIGLIGKYVELRDAYKSIQESFVHAGAENRLKVVVHSIHSEHITEGNVSRMLAHLDGILVAPGFGERGIEGKVLAVQYAREKKIPFLGICLGMQMAVIEFGRNVLKLKDCASSEMNPKAKNPVIDLMEEQKKITKMGGTMRLGAYPCEVLKDSKAAKAYKKSRISERHRHRYEFNNAYREAYQNAGMIFSGINPESNLVEIVELPDHPFFVGCQFHPELKSTVENPHPLFVSLVKEAFQFKARNLPV
jgi:CTP synthase